MMRTRLPFIIMLTLILVFGPGQKGLAQQSQQSQQSQKAQKAQKEEMEKQEQKQLEAEMQARKDILEAERAEMREQERQMREQEAKYRVQAREAERARSASRASAVYSSGGYVVVPDEGSQTQLTLRNTFRGGSDSSKGTFDVEKGTSRFRCNINGKVKSGTITIKILYPGGKTFKDLTLNSTAEVSYSQTLSINEEKESTYVGAWTYEVKAEKAEGTYMLSIQTN